MGYCNRRKSKGIHFDSYLKAQDRVRWRVDSTIR
jgi:hypothetical protein